MQMKEYVSSQTEKKHVSSQTDEEACKQPDRAPKLRFLIRNMAPITQAHVMP